MHAFTFFVLVEDLCALLLLLHAQHTFLPCALYLCVYAHCADLMRYERESSHEMMINIIEQQHKKKPSTSTSTKEKMYMKMGTCEE